MFDDAVLTKDVTAGTAVTVMVFVELPPLTLIVPPVVRFPVSAKVAAGAVIFNMPLPTGAVNVVKLVAVDKSTVSVPVYVSAVAVKVVNVEGAINVAYPVAAIVPAPNVGVVPLNVAYVLALAETFKISAPLPKSVIVSVPEVTVIVSMPAPPVIVSAPAPPEIASAPEPVVIVSAAEPPVTLAVPEAPNVVLKFNAAAFESLSVTTNLAAAVKAPLIESAPLPKSLKVKVPVDAGLIMNVSAPVPPAKVAEDAALNNNVLILSLAVPPVKVAVAVPPVIVKALVSNVATMLVMPDKLASTVTMPAVAAPVPKTTVPEVTVDANDNTSTPFTLEKSVVFTPIVPAAPDVPIILSVSVPSPPAAVASAIKAVSSTTVIVSFPAPAVILSAPPLPIIVSLAAPPLIVSASVLPVICTAVFPAVITVAAVNPETSFVIAIPDAVEVPPVIVM